MIKAKGDMYDWVDFTWNPLAGECPHHCTYCYVRDLPKPVVEGKYSGPPRIDQKAIQEGLGSGRTIFVCSCADLFADGVSADDIELILHHCGLYPDNTYVLQTKNPNRYYQFHQSFPPEVILGTTIESDIDYRPQMGNAPHPLERFEAIAVLSAYKRFVTLEPIMDFQPQKLAHWLNLIHPDWVNIGADSGGHNLPEPTKEKLVELTGLLKTYGIEVRRKTNLGRLL